MLNYLSFAIQIFVLFFRFLFSIDSQIKKKIVHTTKFRLDKIDEITGKFAMDYALKLDEIQKYAQGRGKLEYEFSHKGARGIQLEFEPKRSKKEQNDKDNDRDVQSKN